MFVGFHPMELTRYINVQWCGCLLWYSYEVDSLHAILLILSCMWLINWFKRSIELIQVTSWSLICYNSGS